MITTAMQGASEIACVLNVLGGEGVCLGVLFDC